MMINAITASSVDIGGLSLHINQEQKPDDPLLDSQTPSIAFPTEDKIRQGVSLWSQRRASAGAILSSVGLGILVLAKLGQR